MQRFVTFLREQMEKKKKKTRVFPFPARGIGRETGPIALFLISRYSPQGLSESSLLSGFHLQMSRRNGRVGIGRLQEE